MARHAVRPSNRESLIIDSNGIKALRSSASWLSQTCV
jgi:hypothetical protein